VTGVQTCALPICILLRQDESTYIDLTLNEPPLQAAK
jgi:hypothetical protein